MNIKKELVEQYLRLLNNEIETLDGIRDKPAEILATTGRMRYYVTCILSHIPELPQEDVSRVMKSIEKVKQDIYSFTQTISSNPCV